MKFNSIEFLIFLPCVLLVVAMVGTRWRNNFLLAASYFFYGYWDFRFVTLLLATQIVDYWVGNQIFATSDPQRRKRILFLSICANLGALGFFKYYNFFIGSGVAALQTLGLHATAPTLSIILPLGLSFYVFQSMSYTIDIYRGTLEPAKRFWDFALFVVYFPHLVAGPIVRPGILLPQLLAPAKFSAERVNAALTLIVIGFTKKVLIADNLAPEVQRIFAHPDQMSSGLLLKGAYFFAFQIYCDFSGYSDIARGVSELLGIKLTINFNQPYLSQSITEFWRRWHISLSTWLRDYLYVPLGGNRGGKWDTYRNLMLTMLIGGLWHGAAWTFVAWGGLHGLCLTVERALGIGRDELPVHESAAWQFLRSAARMTITFHLVALLWIFFRAPTFTIAAQYFAGILKFSDLGAIGIQPLIVALAVFAIDIPQKISGEHTIFVRTPWWIRSPVYCGLCFAVLGMLLYGGRELPFIYFQF